MSAFSSIGGTTTATNSGGYIVVSGVTFTTTGTTTWLPISTTATGSQVDIYQIPKEVEAPVLLQKNTIYKMPNGSEVIIDNDGGFTVNDKDAKVIYRANRVYDFNPFLNASDLLEEYIQELAPQGIRQDQVLKIPIIHFIYWLLHKIAEKDNEPVPKDIPRLPRIGFDSNGLRVYSRCLNCGRFINTAYANARIYYCSPDHMSKQIRILEDA
jgi:hypothetical protein